MCLVSQNQLCNSKDINLSKAEFNLQSELCQLSKNLLSGTTIILLPLCLVREKKGTPVS